MEIQFLSNRCKAAHFIDKRLSRQIRFMDGAARFTIKFPVYYTCASLLN
jgi:hypothetical protein